jgi:hypothetical protein
MFEEDINLDSNKFLNSFIFNQPKQLNNQKLSEDSENLEEEKINE